MTVLCALWVAIAAVLRLVYHGEVLPGTTMAGTAVGGADAAEVRRVLARVNRGDRTVVLVFGERRFTVTAEVAGLRVHIRRSVERALAAGRGGALDFVATPASVLGLRPLDLQVHYVLSAPRLAGQITEIAREIERPPFHGGLSIDPSTLAVRIEPPRDGRDMDRRAAARLLAARLRDGTQGPLALPVRIRRAPPAREVKRMAVQARAYLAKGSMRLTGAGPAIALRPRRVAGILALERRGAKVALGVDDRAVERLVAQLGAQRDRPPRDARIDAPPARVVLDAMGNVRWRPRRATVEQRPSALKSLLGPPLPRPPQRVGREERSVRAHSVEDDRVLREVDLDQTPRRRPPFSVRASR